MLQTQSTSSDLIPFIAFKPRQIMLSNTNMKKHPNSHEVCSQNASAHKLAPTLKPHQKLPPILKPHQNTLLLHSISHFLQRNGFSKTLKKFRSEAKLDQNDGWKGCLLSLEEMYFKCLETSANTNFDSYKEQDLEIDGITKIDEDYNCVASVETVSKKKKKRSDGSDSNAVVDQPGPAETLNNIKNSEETLTNDLIPESNVKFKEKKKSKKSFDTVGQGNEQVGSEVLKEPAEDIACEQQLDESSKKCKNKKKKRKKLVSESLVDNAEHHQLEALSGVMEENSKNLVSLEGKITTDFDINDKSKDKKRKRDKLSYDSQVVNSTMDNTCEIPSEEKNVKSKSKKRKKDGLVSESLPGGDMEELDSGKLRTDSKKDDFQNLDEDATSKEKKGSKKIKRLASEGGDSQPINKVAIDECKRRKTEGLEESKTSEQLMKVNASLGNDGHASNKSKDEIDKVGFNDAQKTPIKQLDTQENGNLERNGEKYAMQKTLKKQHNGSVEPKTVNAFQRVKIDEVVFVDEKLQDNSYWAKDGAEIGYGAKAQEVLGQVRGRDFRHEKTKKKRGSYRGGQIDLQSHSVKFNYSDEE